MKKTLLRLFIVGLVLYVLTVLSERNNLAPSEITVFKFDRLEPIWDASTAVQTKTYFVSGTGDDLNNGSEIYPFRTINHALKILKPGNVLLVRAGTYTEALSDIPSGESWFYPVIVRAYPRENVVIKPSSGANRVIEFRAASSSRFIIIDGFILDGANVTYEVIKFQENSPATAPHDIQIINSEIRNAPAHGILTNDDTNKLYFGNLLVHDNGRSDFHHGLYIKSSNVLVEKCTIYRNSGWGIHIYGGTDNNNTIRNNLVFNNARIGNRGAGIGIYTGQGNQVYNNIIWGNKTGVTVNYGARITNIINNTIVNNVDFGVFIGDGSTNAIVQNNIIVHANTELIIDNGIETVLTNNLVGQDRKFVDSGNFNFHLRLGSPAINKGVVTPTIRTDFDGTLRPQSRPYTIGAFEYFSALSNEMP